MVETQTFVDALVYMCWKPTAAANLNDLIHYERPQVMVIPYPEEDAQVEETEEEEEEPVEGIDEIDEALGQLSVEGREDTSVSDVSTITQSSATEEIATGVSGASLPHASTSSDSHCYISRLHILAAPTRNSQAPGEASTLDDGGKQR